MSDLWLNIRIKDWHIQCGENKWYHASINYNPYHKEKNYPDGWFSWY